MGSQDCHADAWSDMPRYGDVFQFDRERWLDHLKGHWVVHPLPEPSFGAALTNVRVFDKPVRCRGNLYFFPLPPSVHNAVAEQLRLNGIELTTGTLEASTV